MSDGDYDSETHTQLEVDVVIEDTQTRLGEMIEKVDMWLERLNKGQVSEDQRRHYIRMMAAEIYANSRADLARAVDEAVQLYDLCEKRFEEG